MAVPYPSNPAVGDSFTYLGVVYTWNGVAWISEFTNTPGSVGSVAVTAPITNSGTPTAPVIGISQGALVIDESQVTNLVSDLSGKANLAGGNAFTEAQTITGSVTTSTPLTLKGASGQTASLFEIRNASNTLLSYTLSNGDWVMPNLFNSYAGVGTGYSDYQGGATSLYVRPTTVARTGAIIKGLASQTADLQQWQDSTGSVRVAVDSIGRINSQSAANLGGFPVGLAVLGVQTSSSTTLVNAIRGAASQTQDLTQWQNSAGTVLAGSNANGQIFSGATTPINYQVGGTPTATSGTGSIATITLTSASNLAIGDLIRVTGFTPTGYNTSGNVVVTAVSNSAPFSVSYASTATGAMTVAGQVQTVPQASFTARSTATVPLIVKGNGYNMNLQTWLKSDNNNGIIINPYGSLVGYASANQFNSDNGANYIFRTVGVSDQRANHYQVVNSSSIILAGFNAQGQLFTGRTLPDTGATTVAIGTQTPTGTTNITITTGAAHGIVVGQTVIIAGVTPVGYNGTWTAQAGTTGTTLVVNIGSNPGAITVAGTVVQSAQLSVTATSVNNTPIVVRGVASQVANLQEWRSSTGSMLARVEAAGNFIIAGIGVTSGDHRVGTSNYFSAALNVLARSTTEKGLVVRGQASQTANLQEWQDSAGTVLTAIDNSGFLKVGATGTGGQVAITATAAGNRPLVLKGAASQTANLQEWQDSTGAVKIYANPSGDMSLGSIGLGFITPYSAYGNALLSISTVGATNKGIVVRAVASQSANLFETQDSATAIKFYIDAVGNANFSSASWVQNSTGKLTLGLTSASAVGLTVRGTGTGGVYTQTANLQEWLSWDGSTPTTLAFMSPAGVLSSKGLTLSGTTSPITLNGSVGTSGQVLTSAGAGATPTWTTVSGGSFTGGTLTSDLVLAAGSGTVEPLTFQTNSATPTVSAGAMDYDGVAFYSVPNATSGRAVNVTEHFWTTTGNSLDFTTTATAKSIIGTATQGITLLAGTTYEFDLYMTVTHTFILGATQAGSVGLTFTTVSGSPTVAYGYQIDYGSNTTGFANAITLTTIASKTSGTTTFSAAIASGSRYSIVRMKGLIKVTGTGSTKFYPSISVNNVNADNGWQVDNYSALKLKPVGNGTVSTVGTWT